MIEQLFRRLLPTQILLAVISSVNGIISGFYGSQFIGADAMSAIGLYAPLNMTFMTISTLLLGGTQVLCGKYMGRGETARIRRVFSVDMALVAIISLLATSVFLLFTDPFARLLGANSDTLPHLVAYLRGMGIGILPLLATQQLSGFLAMEQQTRRTTIGSLVYIAINIVLGYLFVAVLKMGAFGLGLAASLGLWVFLLFLSLYYLRGKAVIFFSLPLHLGDLGAILKIGYPSALSSFYQIIRGFIFNAIILYFVGNAGLAAHATYLTVHYLCWSIPAGVLAVGRLLLSVSYGEEDRKDLVRVMKAVVIKYTLISLAFMLAVSLGAGVIARIFYSDVSTEVYQLTKMGIRIAIPSLALSLIMVTFVAWGQISRKPLLVHLISVLDGVVNCVLFSLLLAPWLGMNGVWLSYMLNCIVCLLAIYLYARRKNRKAPRSVEDMLVLPNDFGVADEDRLDITLTDLDGVSQTAAAVQHFCAERGIDAYRANYAALCLEEMATNILLHGFTKDNRKHSTGIRIVKKGDDVILRLKDDCVPFDPAERKDIIDPADPAKNIGIRTVYKIAKDVNYQHLLGLNILTIKI